VLRNKGQHIADILFNYVKSPEKSIRWTANEAVAAADISKASVSNYFFLRFLRSSGVTEEEEKIN
jgi:hypothetical protein